MFPVLTVWAFKNSTGYSRTIEKRKIVEDSIDSIHLRRRFDVRIGSRHIIEINVWGSER